MKSSSRFFLLLLLLFSPLTHAAPLCNDLFWSEFNDEGSFYSPIKKIKMVLNNFDFVPRVINNKTPIVEEKIYDAIVVGSGPAGLTTTLKLARAGANVLNLEKQKTIGGLAQGKVRNGEPYATGTAYYSGLIKVQEWLFKVLGIKDYKESAIHHPSDALYVRRGIVMPDGTEKHLFIDFWENDEVIRQLPACVELTRWTHRYLDKLGKIPNQPLEDAKSPYDKMTYEQFLHSQFGILKRYVKRNPKDKDAKALLTRIYQEIESGVLDPKITGTNKGIMNFMINFYMDNYGHSAKGGYSSEVNALSFMNFILSEMTIRYTYQMGTHEIAQKTYDVIKRHANAEIRVESEVISIEEKPNYVEITYANKGQRYIVRAKTYAFSAPLTMAPKLIKDFDKIAPRQSKIIEGYIKNEQETDYIVINLFIKGFPYAVRLAYDLWLGDDYFFPDRPPDVISSDWFTYKGFTVEPPPDAKVGKLAIYQPLGNKYKSFRGCRSCYIQLIERSIAYVEEVYKNLAAETGGEPIEILFAEATFWPNSILSPRVNHFANTKILEKGIGARGHFSQSGLGAPAIEESQYRGIVTADRMIKELGLPPEEVPTEEQPLN